ncbi:MAG: hypothetical protein OXB88_04145, partial [Bacteriovoracales bacterium]|nr:hypothetical protein [Bacteriovoracales bacterium]
VFAGDDIADFALDTSSSLFHKFWGSKWACVNAELEDLGTYENLVEGKYFDEASALLGFTVDTGRNRGRTRPMTRSSTPRSLTTRPGARRTIGARPLGQKARSVKAEEDSEENTSIFAEEENGGLKPKMSRVSSLSRSPLAKTKELDQFVMEALSEEKEISPSLIHKVAEQALMSDQVFKFCLANHYIIRWKEKTELISFLDSFNLFSSEEKSKEKSREIDPELYKEFQVLFYKRFLYLKEKILDDLEKREVAMYVTKMFHQLVNDEDGLNECAFEEDNPRYEECIFKNLKEEVEELAEVGLDVKDVGDLQRLYEEGKIPYSKWRIIERKRKMIEDKKQVVDSILGRSPRDNSRYRPWPPKDDGSRQRPPSRRYPRPR